jgi:clan AA aspartic protease
LIFGVVAPDATEATVEVVVRGPTGAERRIAAIVDTGFTGALTLPTPVVDELSLPFVIEQRAILADGRQVVARAYEATIVWDRHERLVRSLATGSTALIGMGLLNGYELVVHVVDGGAVRIMPL